MRRVGCARFVVVAQQMHQSMCGKYRDFNLDGVAMTACLTPRDFPADGEVTEAYRQTGEHGVVVVFGVAKRQHVRGPGLVAVGLVERGDFAIGKKRDVDHEVAESRGNGKPRKAA